MGLLNELSVTRSARAARLKRMTAGLGAVALIASSVLLWQSPASPAPADLFEITDANIVDESAPAPDWGSLFYRTPTGRAGAPVSITTAAGLTGTSFVQDLMSESPLPSPPCTAGKKGDLSVFTGAGSDKNGDPIPEWTYASGSVPVKDDITNLYGTSATDTNAHRIIYFGFERAANNGDSHVDVEFLQAPMGQERTGTDARGCPSGHFTGSRTVGDMLVVLDFQNGGTNGLAGIRLWDGSAYVVPAVPVSAGIAGLWHNQDNSIACGDWNCLGPNASVISTLATNTFIEGFVDATALGLTGCFSSFNAKSRSAHSYTSELKDIAFGEFNTCDANITITPDGVNPVGTEHTFTGHVNTNESGAYSNAPAGTLIEFDIVSGPGAFTGGVDTCTTIGTTGSCTVTITSTTAGETVVSASTTSLVGPVTVTRSTDGNAGTGGSGNATKHWADGYIKVTPDEVNPVNEQHVFAVEFGVMTGGADTVSDVSITPAVTKGATDPALVTNDDNCASPTETALGSHIYQCTITINSSGAGTYTATASGSAFVSDTNISGAAAVIKRSSTASAHGPDGNDGAVKTYVDARILIGADGLNPVDANHTVTATVQTKDGSGAWIGAPAGTAINFDLEGAGGFVGGTSSCLTSATSAGRCSVAIVSSVAGTTTLDASATVVVNTITIKRTTATTVNTAAGGSGSLTKKWVDGSISISESAFNEVTDEHVFTITATAIRPSSETVTFTSITPSVSPTPGTAATTCSDPIVVGLTATCTYTINSPTAGVFDVDATAVIHFTGGGFTADITRITAAGGDHGPNGGGGSTKTFVDSRVSVGLDGVNAVGDPHAVTGFAEYNDGSGWRPAAGKTITYASQGVGAFVGGVSTCVSNSIGSCTVHIVADDAGIQWVSASTSYPVQGVILSRTTAGAGATDPANLRKEWVAAGISITPVAVNEVGQAHRFAITVTAESSGSDIVFGPVGTSVSPTTTSSHDCGSAAPVSDPENPAVKTLSCTLTINSSVAGVFTANASDTVTIGGVVFRLTTDGIGANSGPAVKTYVDARISLTPSGVNEVGDPHPMTARLELNDGSGWTAADDTTIAVTKLSGPGALSSSDCVTDADGECNVSLTSPTAGVSVVSATATTSVGGLTLVRSTNNNAGPGGSGNVTKRWVDASVSISPTATNPVGAAHTFTVNVTAVPSGAAPVVFTSVTPTVTPHPASMTSNCATPLVDPGDSNKVSCTVTMNSDAAGVFTANVTAVVSMGGVSVTRATNGNSGPAGSGPATKTYVDADIQVGPDGVNPVTQPHTVTGQVNVNPGTGSINAPDGTIIGFTIVSGPGSLTAPSCTTSGGMGSCSVTLDSAIAGVTVVSAASRVTIVNVVLDLATTGSGANSDDLTKRWVDAFVTVGPSAVNPLNEEHVFTVTVTAIPSGAAPVWFDSITASLSPAPGSLASTCASPVVSGNDATCTVTVNSAVAGEFVANATARLYIDGAALFRSTDRAVASAGPGGSGPATKTYVAGAVVLGEVITRPPQLPTTGAPLFLQIGAGLAMLAVGALAVGVTRRRRAIDS